MFFTAPTPPFFLPISKVQFYSVFCHFSFFGFCENEFIYRYYCPIKPISASLPEKLSYWVKFSKSTSPSDFRKHFLEDQTTKKNNYVRTIFLEKFSKFRISVLLTNTMLLKNISSQTEDLNYRNAATTQQCFRGTGSPLSQITFDLCLCYNISI